MKKMSTLSILVVSALVIFPFLSCSGGNVDSLADSNSMSDEAYNAKYGELIPDDTIPSKIEESFLEDEGSVPFHESADILASDFQPYGSDSSKVKYPGILLEESADDEEGYEEEDEDGDDEGEYYEEEEEESGDDEEAGYEDEGEAEDEDEEVEDEYTEDEDEETEDEEDSEEEEVEQEDPEE